MTILIPRNIEGRKEKLRHVNIQLLSQEIIEGDLIIDESFEGIPDELIKVKEIKGNVILCIKKGYIPSWLKDVKILSSFECMFNKLTSLKNCPQYIGQNFGCIYNNLTSLDGCPKYIGKNLYCHHNKEKLKLPKGVEVKGNIINL